ncbi:MAG: hypothetical protein MZW92_71430 [Comamonadaceae bacterium]|nr:hypothetical protein [Comamonadaceae bacterium]
MKDAGGNPIRGKWVAPSGDGIDFAVTKAPGSRGRDDGLAFDWLGGDDPFIMRPDGKAWLFAPFGLVDGPLPAHYEPYESPVRNVVYKQQANPVVKVWKVDGNPYHNVADPSYPIVVTTYRLTEHYLERIHEPLAALACGADARALPARSHRSLQRKRVSGTETT